MTQELKKLHIKTYGCQMNVYDSQKMAELLAPHGFVLSDQMEGADVVILNTCHIREKASEKVYSELGRVREQKDIKKASGDHMVIVVAGCVAQAEGSEILSRAPYVDIVVGSQSYYMLPQLIEEVKRTKKWAINLDFPTESKFDLLPEAAENVDIASFLSIQEGCDKFCHFCVVPYTRGAEISRSMPSVYREALRLASHGAREITLLGQNVSGYHGEGEDGSEVSLGHLIKHLAKIDDIKRIRYMTSHPRDMVDEELFEAHASIDKLMPFLHLPIQSGSNKILDAMNRKHTRELYLEVIAKFRKARPDMAFSSDFIVGYPGETDQDFEDTMAIVEEVEYAQCYSFKYSPRPGTPASVLDTQVPEDIKDARLARLQAKIREKQLKFNNASLGKTMKVLFDHKGRHDGQLIGKTEYMQAVYVDAPEQLLGSICDVYIEKVDSNSLKGKIL